MFGVRDSLIVTYQRHEAGMAPDGRVLGKPFYTAQYDIALALAAVGRMRQG